MDLAEKFQKLIDDYNAGSQNIEAFFAGAEGLRRRPDAEEQRGHCRGADRGRAGAVRHPDQARAGADQGRGGEVKKVCRELLATLKREKLVLDWREKQQAKAADAVKEMQTGYAHVYDYGDGASAYSWH
jgi:type I restriction enzyme R subunit